MKENLQVSVIVPLYQDAATIGRCLEGLCAQTVFDSMEIIVVDDGSTDGGAEIVRKYPVRLMQQQNAGPAAARNRGASQARGDIFVFLDSDCEVDSDWVEKIARHFDDGKVDAVLCRLELARPGIVPTIVQSEIEERYERLRDPNRKIDFIAAAACAVKASTFQKVDGFNEGFKMNEDVELAFRLDEAGNRIGFADDAPARHAHQQGWMKLIRTKFWRGVWRMRLYRLYPEKRRADSWTPAILKVQIAAAALIGPTFVAVFFDPRALWLILGLVVAILVTGSSLIASTARQLFPVAGFRAPFAAALWIIARAVTLAASVIYAAVVPWSAPTARDIFTKSSTAAFSHFAFVRAQRSSIRRPSRPRHP